jgi:FAD dependent oxidoreductase TIGR03364
MAANVEGVRGLVAEQSGVYDLAVVGSGILGLASALAAARQGKRVIVIEKSAQPVGASIRNFGFVTVTGQRRGAHWKRALRSRDVWAEIAPQAGIEIVHRGLVLVARRPEAAAVLEAFLRTEMGEGCRLVSQAEARDIVPSLKPGAAALLHSPHDLRVESRDAVPRLAAWLREEMGVAFMTGIHVHEVAPPRIRTSEGTVEAEAAVVCPGDDFSSLFPERLRAAKLGICILQMLRVQPATPTPFGAAVMTDLSLARYEGYSGLPESEPLRQRLEREQTEELEAGVHLIAVQSADGSLVVGDSHAYGDTALPFARESVDDLILRELDKVVDLPGRQVVQRWTGSYATRTGEVVFFDRPSDALRILIVTGGTGASTAFALGQEAVGDLFGSHANRVEADAGALS